MKQFEIQKNKAKKWKKPRTIDKILPDFMDLYNSDQEKAIKFIFYLRSHNRSIMTEKGLIKSFGLGLKHEGLMRMLILHIINPDLFWKYIEDYIQIASWRDIFLMLKFDVQSNGWDKRILDWNKFFALINRNLHNDFQKDYVKKYMPRLTSKSQAQTPGKAANLKVAKWLCSQLFNCKEADPHSYKKYRLLKSSGKEHDFLKKISQGRPDLIDFEKLPKKAKKIFRKNKNAVYAINYTDKVINKPFNIPKYDNINELFLVFEGMTRIKF